MKLLKPHWVTHGYMCKSSNWHRPIYSLDIHPDGSRLATGGSNESGGLIILWDMSLIRDPTKESKSVPKQLFRMENHEGCVNTVRWSPTGRWLASGSLDQTVMIWEKTTGERAGGVFGLKEKFSEHWRRVVALRNHNGDVVDLAWSQDGTRIASTSVDNTVAIYGVSQINDIQQQPFQLITILRGHRGPVKGVTWDPAGRFLATHSDGIGVRIWRTADWQPEGTVSSPFTDEVDQTALMRMSWSPDGSYIAAPHAVNNDFPTVQLINRNRWQTGSDLVGHEKHLTCVRYNPNILKKAGNNGFIEMVSLALGGKDRCLSVWTTSGNRALVVVRDLFTNAISDLTWSTSGRELLASSLDGSIAYLCFTKEELGEPLKLEEVAQMHHKAYGQSLIDNLLNAAKSSPESKFTLAFGQKAGNVVLETPEALALQRQQEELRQKMGDVPSDASGVKVAAKVQWSTQTESRTKDGRRRITPSFLRTVECVVEEPPSTLPNISKESSKIPSIRLPPKAAAVTAPVPKPLEVPAAEGCGNMPITSTNSGVLPVATKSPSSTAISTPSKRSGDNLLIPGDSTASSGRNKKRVEMTTISDDTRAIEKQVKVPAKKRRRVRAGVDDDVEDVVAKTTKAPAHNPPAKSIERISERLDDRSSVQAVISKVPRIKVSDQLELCGNQTQFVCAHPIDGPIVVKIVNSESGKSALHRITGSQSTDGNVKIVWTFLSSHRFTSHAHSNKWLAVGDANSSLRLLWSTGCAICPPLCLDSPAQILANTTLSDSTEHLGVLTVSGCLTLWKLSPKMLSSSGSHIGCDTEHDLPKIVLTTRLDITHSPAVDLTFTPGEIKHLVVHFKLGSSVLFHVDRKLWIELFNSGEGDEDSFKRRAAATLHRTCPSGPLSEMQKFGRLNVVVTGGLSATTITQRKDLQEFYDAQIQVAEMLGSAAEFKFWLLRWFQQLVIEGDERRIRQVCLDFIGPISPAHSTSWNPTIKGLSKRSLMKDLFTQFALNLRMQRLYVEMKEQYDNIQETE